MALVLFPVSHLPGWRTSSPKLLWSKDQVVDGVEIVGPAGHLPCVHPLVMLLVWIILRTNLEKICVSCSLQYILIPQTLTKHLLAAGIVLGP